MKEKTLLNQNALNVFNNSNKDFINYEMQELLFFKNDMLKDMKKLDDKFTNIKPPPKKNQRYNSKLPNKIRLILNNLIRLKNS
jgi:5-bromo-4-chloroindolyl phosphate hydrolysis protein